MTVPVLAAAATLLGGGALALDGAGLSTGAPFALLITVSVFLVTAPATAVAVSLRRLDPLGRMVLAVAAAVVVNALVAEVMLITNRWSIPGGVVAVAAISAVLWLVLSATSTWPAGWAGSKRTGDVRARSAGGERTS